MDSSVSAAGEYVIFRPRDCGFIELAMSFMSACAHTPGTSCSEALRGLLDSSWQAKFVMLILKLLHAVAKILASFGEIVEICLNTTHVNGGLLGILHRIISGNGIVIPDEQSDDYWSVIGFLDPRTGLLLDEDNASRQFATEPPESKLMADICMMASKLSYENARIIRKVIATEWKMHLVDVFECLNKYEPTNPTQVLIFTDKAQDAQAIVVTFRGTMPFNAYDWSTDFDFSWYQLPGIGRVHVGFLEALSLVDRHDMESFTRMSNNVAEFHKTGRRRYPTSGLAELAPSDYEEQQQQQQKEKKKKKKWKKKKKKKKKPVLAYDTAVDTVKELLQTHKNAKVYVTGHSLGGALATVFTTMLFYNREDLITEKLAALYTFGQPRVGDREFAATMSSKLNSPSRMFRIVYSSDIVPRVPFDNFLFQFKHIEPCLYYTRLYTEKVLNAEPNRDYFSPLYFLRNHVVAVWELYQSFVRHSRYGESYRESSASKVLRLIGLVFPGISAHSPVNYVNSVRLGPQMLR